MVRCHFTNTIYYTSTNQVLPMWKIITHVAGKMTICIKLSRVSNTKKINIDSISEFKKFKDIYKAL